MNKQFRSTVLGASIFWTALLSGCASVNYPKATVATNIPFFYSSSITVRNSAGSGVAITPQSRGGGFVTEYKLGKRLWQTLWLTREKIPTKVLELNHGESATVPLYRNTSDRAVDIPFAVLVKQNGKVIGSYSHCVRVYPNENANPELNFGPNDLRGLKLGYIGRECR